MQASQVILADVGVQSRVPHNLGISALPRHYLLTITFLFFIPFSAEYGIIQPLT